MGKKVDFVQTIIIFAGLAMIGYGIWNIVLWAQNMRNPNATDMQAAGFGFIGGGIALIVLALRFIR